MTVTVTGEVEPGANSNKCYETWAFCRGVRARVNPEDGTFSLPGVPLYPGTNMLLVRVRDVSGNDAEQTRTVVRTNALETFEYDGNGNLTNWVKAGENWAYEWDWADRLVKASSNGVVVLENWFDAQSRKIAKAEVVNGQMVKTLYLYDGWDIVGVMNETGQMRETFTRGVGLAGDIGTLVAVTHHAGSWTNGTFYAHHNHRGDIVLTRSGATTVVRYDYAAFGSLKSQTGPDVCRFKFSSKERDVSTGFSYYGYRFYSPQWQRWLNADPIGEEGGPNLYGFVNNAGIDQVDPLGLYGSSIDNAVRTCMALPSPAARIKCLEDLIDTLGGGKSKRCCVLAAVVRVAKEKAAGWGKCQRSDSCAVLKAKSDAWLAVAAARARLNKICFGGGDPGHQQQLADVYVVIGRYTKYQVEKGCKGPL